MKVLYLIRHAESKEKFSFLPNKHSDLSDNGFLEALILSEGLADQNITADLIITSPAQHALTTAQVIADRIGLDRECIVVDEDLYLATETEAMAVIRKIDNSFNNVIIVGHDPAISGLIFRFSKPSIISSPMASAACISFLTPDWRTVRHAPHSLHYLLVNGKEADIKSKEIIIL